MNSEFLTALGRLPLNYVVLCILAFNLVGLEVSLVILELCLAGLELSLAIYEESLGQNSCL